jgi:V/A-type H+/Na+-transporting ATPase subunit K
MDLGMIGVAAALGLAAVGSSAGLGIAGMATIGAWKKCLQRNKPMPFNMLIYAAAPLTQTIYGMITMNAILGSDKDPILRMAAGLFAGLAIGVSALFQGKCSAAASDAFADTGGGFGIFLMDIGLTESIAIFTMVFTMGIMG